MFMKHLLEPMGSILDSTITVEYKTRFRTTQLPRIFEGGRNELCTVFLKFYVK